MEIDIASKIVVDDSSEEELKSALDSGIARAVMILRQDGVETFESCEGGESHSFPEPTIRFHGQYPS